ncbi:MAG: hypothetical protein KF823_09315 [Xanthomonadales bacterium]|nr:hypothetical protein [Xanthomonadales bacterium]
MTANITEATTKVYGVLEGLTSEERKRVVRAALMLLGDELEEAARRGTPSTTQARISSADDDDLSVIHEGARAWVRKNGLLMSSLEHFFHFDQGRVQPIALPGSATSKREQTLNTYLAQGLAAHLSTGEPAFSDEQARMLCKQFGCYDSANHAKIVKELKNRITGSKSAGWKLTTPGLTAAADLVKQ